MMLCLKSIILLHILIYVGAGASIAHGNSRVRPVMPPIAKATKNPTPTAKSNDHSENIPVLKIENEWESAPKNFGTPKETQKSNLSVRVEDIVEPPSDYHYASFGYPDPFLPPLQAEPSERITGSSEVPLISPLQKYAIADLKIAGVWLTTDSAWKTLIMTPKGEGIIAKVNDPIANKEGKITAINDEGIRVREYRTNPDGTREIIDTKILLSPTGDGENILTTTSPVDSIENAPAEAKSPFKSLPASPASKVPASIIDPEAIPPEVDLPEQVSVQRDIVGETAAKLTEAAEKEAAKVPVKDRSDKEALNTQSSSPVVPPNSKEKTP